MKRTAKGLVVSTAGSRSTFLASTDVLARDGLVIEKNAWQVDNFKRNPVIQWSHRYDMPPIGRATGIRTTNAGLEVDIEFDMADDFAAGIARKVKDGFLSAVSVGFDVLNQVGSRITSAELLEVSVVPVPADPGALAIARSAFIKTRKPSSSTTYSDTDLKAVGKALDRFQASVIRSKWQEEDRQANAERADAFKGMLREAFIFEGLRRMSEGQRRAFLATLSPSELRQIDTITQRATTRAA